MTAPLLVRLVTVVVLAAPFVLTGCGRKGALDPPPKATAVAQPAGQPGAPAADAVDEEGHPIVKPQKKGFFLDWMLN